MWTFWRYQEPGADPLDHIPEGVDEEGVHVIDYAEFATTTSLFFAVEHLTLNETLDEVLDSSWENLRIPAWGRGEEPMTWYFDIGYPEGTYRMTCHEDEESPYLPEWGWGSMLVCDWPEGAQTVWGTPLELW